MTYQVIRSKRKTMSLEVNRNGEVVVRVPLRVSEKTIEAFVLEHKAWIEKALVKVEKRKEETGNVEKLTEEEFNALCEKAMKVIPERVKYYAPEVGVTYGRITLRNQKTKWGSCSAKGNLNFNVLLMLMPDDVIDSIVVHELCHRKEMNHSKKFYDEVYRVFPKYDECHKWLKKNGNQIMRRLFD